jgi:hypothetical protein
MDIIAVADLVTNSKVTSIASKVEKRIDMGHAIRTLVSRKFHDYAVGITF